MSTATTTTVWQLVCPLRSGLVPSTTVNLPASFTPSSLMSAEAGQPAISVSPGGTTLPPDIYGGDMGPRLTVAVPIHTTLIVEYFPTPVPNPIESYRPIYVVSGDGSMVTSVYWNAAMNTHLRMILMGFLLCFFLRNLIVSIGYLRRGRIKDKTLFYLLVASQLLGPVALITIITGLLHNNPNCKVINILWMSAMHTSLSLLITGILGLKAYRCLNSSRIVLFLLAGFQISSTVLFGKEIATSVHFFTLDGTCQIRSLNSNLYLGMVLTFCETGVLSLCFMLALLRSSGVASAQGRVSVVSHLESTSEAAAPVPNFHTGRGWWDYVPSSGNRRASGTSHLVNEFTGHTPIPRRRSFLSLIAHIPLPAIIVRIFTGNRFVVGPNGIVRKSSIPGLYPVPALPVPQNQEEKTYPRRMSVHGADSTFPRVVNQELEKSWQRKLPNVVRLVIKDEMFSTVILTFCCVSSAIVVSFVAANGSDLTTSVWLLLNWALTSALVMRSFSQVVRRHEKQYLIEQSVSRGIYPPCPATIRGAALNRQNSLQTISSLETTSTDTGSNPRDTLGTWVTISDPHDIIHHQQWPTPPSDGLSRRFDSSQGLHGGNIRTPTQPGLSNQHQSGKIGSDDEHSNPFEYDEELRGDLATQTSFQRHRWSGGAASTSSRYTEQSDPHGIRINVISPSARSSGTALGEDHRPIESISPSTIPPLPTNRLNTPSV